MINVKLKQSIAKLLSYLFTIFVVVGAMFFLMRLAPGNPIAAIIDPHLSSKHIESMKENIGLNKNTLEQFAAFLGNVIQGDFGYSITYQEKVSVLIGEALPFTVLFALSSFVLQLLTSLALVLHFRKNKSSFAEKVFSKTSLFFYSLPTFFIGLSLVLLFSVILKILPFSDFHSLRYDELNTIEKIFDVVKHMLLPLVTISLSGIIIFYNYLKKNIEQTEAKTFVKFLKANNVDDKAIFRKHILPNSLNPLVSILGAELGILLGGAVITETLFSLPGFGRLTVTAILTRDYHLIIGCVFWAIVATSITNFLADVVKIKLDFQQKQIAETDA